MRRLMVIGLVCLVGVRVVAEPELKGTASDLAQYLNTIPKTVAVTGEAEVRVPAHRAVLSLRVVIENRSLQEALRLNGDVRGKLAEHLKKQGITADRIQASRFSSTPQFGIFGEKARSYRVENAVRVAVQDEKEFQSATGAIDMWPEIQFGGVEFEYTDREALKAKAVSQACDNASERKKIYEEKLGLKLTPVRFSENDVVPMEINALGYGSSMKRNYPASASMASPESNSTAAAVSSFGELVYNARVTIEYSVQAK